MGCEREAVKKFRVGWSFLWFCTVHGKGKEIINEDASHNEKEVPSVPSVPLDKASRDKKDKKDNFSRYGGVFSKDD